jgi:hypothetical protein
MLGENKVQEADRKWQAMADLPGLGWSVIGHLQTNKAGVVARFASEFQALDSLRVAAALDRRLQAEGRALDVFVQVNTSGEASKYGLAPAELPAFVRALPGFTALRPRGLMTLARLSADAAQVRPCFALLRQLREQLRQDTPAGLALDGCPWACRAIRAGHRGRRHRGAWARRSSARAPCPTAITGPPPGRPRPPAPVPGAPPMTRPPSPSATCISKTWAAWPRCCERGYTVHELDAAEAGAAGLGAPGLAEADLLVLLGARWAPSTRRSTR